jgi:hypothetical protein
MYCKKVVKSACQSTIVKAQLPKHNCQTCRSPRRGANSIPNFKEIENWENDVIFLILASASIKKDEQAPLLRAASRTYAQRYL